MPEWETRLRKRAHIIEIGEKSYKTKFGSSNEHRLWTNYLNASKGDRIVRGGTWNGKSLADKKNFPKDSSGKVNWFLKDKDGVQAWKRLEFTDTQTKKGNVKFKWDLLDESGKGNLKNQVDNAFFTGKFAKSTSAYDLQQVLNQKEFTYKGKKVKLGNILNEKLFGDLKGRSWSEVHHNAEGGVKADPYKTQLVTRDANQNLRVLDSTYTADIKRIKNPQELKVRTQKFIDDIVAQKGGIQWGTKGIKPTAVSVVQTVAKKAGLTKILSPLIAEMDGKSLAQYKKAYPKCFKQDVGGNALICLTEQAEKNPELFAKNSLNIAKATEGTKVGTQVANLLTKMKPFLRGTGWLAAGEAVIAPMFALGPYAKGKTWKRSMSDALYGLNKKWSLGLAESEADEIRENTGQLGYDAWKMKQIDAERKATIEKLNNIEQSDTQYGRGQGSYNTFVLTDKLEKLTKEYNALSQQFLSGEVDAEGNPIGNELFDTALNNLTAGTQQIEKFDKQRVGERQQRWQKVGRTLIDKPREAFIDFTLGPNWKENLPEQQNQFYKKRYPRNPRELGQHLSYDPDIPMFAEGGIAGLLKK